MALTLLNLEAPQVQAKPAEVRANPLENPAVPLFSGAAWLYDAFGADPTAAGVSINETSAMEGLLTVYACVNVLASDIASLPLKTYELTDKGRRPAEETDLYYLLAVEPNPEMTSADFFSTVTASAVLTGSGYAEIQRDVTGKAVALYPRHPSTTKPVRLPNGDLAFESRDTGKARIVKNEDMLHIKGVTVDGYGSGISPIQAAKQTLGLHKAAELNTAKFFGNGSRPSGILTVPAEMDDQQRINAKESWERANSGGNQGRSAVLPSGFTWQQLSVSPEDSQFIATMQWTRTQIAGLFRVPPHMVGDTSRLSNGNHESIALEYVTFSLRPWLTRWEKEVQRKLMPYIGRNAGRYAVAFDYSELIRGDFATQMAGFSTARQWGFATANECRVSLGQNPVGPEGDTLMVPLNMVDAKALLHIPVEPQVPGPKLVDTPDTQTNEDGASRTLITRMAHTYAPLFSDALGRIMSRERRDLESVTRCLLPTLQIVADEATRQAVSSFHLPADEALPTDKIVRDALKTAEKRIADEPIEELTTRLCRAIVIGVFKEAATAVVAPKEAA